MQNYTFQSLSDIEFEALVQDLLQKGLKMTLERFTSGKDKGIDLRCAKGPKNLIVQCKKYQTATSLMASLKKEVSKVNKLQPSRYIIATSVGLTLERKKQIKKLFGPYIKDTKDILGRDDLNDLLGRYEDVEKRHYKLWLSSTNILKKILHSKVSNQSDFEAKRIKENITLYVQNPSFAEAIKIINKENFVIISGIPGIGKTTLARMLVYYFLAKEFEEFIFMSDNVNDGYEYYDENKKQIFLFDDFLGSNLLENKLSRNEEKRIIEFIEQVRNSKNKILILTTREYVLNQARNLFEPFESFDWKKAKCIVDLSKYTRPIRATILYNHIFFSRLPIEHLENLLEDKRFLKIIDHPNYNPRIIEGATIKEQWTYIDPQSFYTKFKEFLDYPESIWNHAFSTSISESSRCLLLLLASTGAPILIDDWRKVFQSFIEVAGGKRALLYSDVIFKQALKELEDTFIKISKDSEDVLVVEFQNPSIYDFLILFLKNNRDYTKDIILSSIYFNQLFAIFTLTEEGGRKIALDAEMGKLYFDHLIKHFSSFGRSELIRVFRYRDKSESYYWFRRESGDFYKVDEVTKNIFWETIPNLKKIIIQTIKSFPLKSLSSTNLDHLTSLIKRNYESLDLNLEELFFNISKNLNSLYDIENLLEVKAIYVDAYREYTSEDLISPRIKEIVESEIHSSAPDEQVELLTRVENVQDEFGLLLEEEISLIKENIEENEKYDEERWSNIDPDDLPSSSPAIPDENQEIIEMFESLRDSSR